MSKNKLNIECLYCGKWFEQSLILWAPSETQCPVCGETKNLKPHKASSGGNAFGYDDAEKPEVKYGYNED